VLGEQRQQIGSFELLILSFLGIGIGTVPCLNQSIAETDWWGEGRISEGAVLCSMKRLIKKGLVQRTKIESNRLCRKARFQYGLTDAGGVELEKCRTIYSAIWSRVR